MVGMMLAVTFALMSRPSPYMCGEYAEPGVPHCRRRLGVHAEADVDVHQLCVGACMRAAAARFKAPRGACPCRPHSRRRPAPCCLSAS
jgi:hypothetical protein